MKKLLSLALILMVCCSSALLFSGCSSKNGEMTLPTETIEITVSRTELGDGNINHYDVVRDKVSTIDVTLKYTENEEQKEYTGKLKGLIDELNATVTMTLTSPGKHTATVTCKGITGSFEYNLTINE